MALVVLLLAACGGGDEGKSASGADVGPVASAAAAPATLGTLKESGFGQDGQYVWVTSVVHNNSEYVGQTVTVSFNLLDDQGEILATESHVESFDRPQADHIVGTQVDVGKQVKVAKVEASLDVQASGAFSDKPFPAMPVSNSKLGKDEYGPGSSVSRLPTRWRRPSRVRAFRCCAGIRRTRSSAAGMRIRSCCRLVVGSRSMSVS